MVMSQHTLTHDPLTIACSAHRDVVKVKSLDPQVQGQVQGLDLRGEGLDLRGEGL